ncbi:MAG: hypothetical protein JW822_08190 [Spirochaetales bacterium]|nr:hypothetical protein [Spirochaetales bacterium]
MRYLSILLFSLILSCATVGTIYKESLPEIGSKLDDDYLGTNCPNKNTGCSFFKTVWFVTYKLSINAQRILTYIETKDYNFVSREGFTVNTTLKEVVDKGFKLEKIPDREGFYGRYVVYLSDGWIAAFNKLSRQADSGVYDYEKPVNDTRIVLFMKH